MRLPVARCVLLALAVQAPTTVRGAEPPQAAASAPAVAKVAPSTRPATGPAAAAALERKLLGTWHGGPCEGTFVFNADGTFVLRNFTPGNNTLGGTWAIRWDALPPTLVLSCTASDFKRKDPGRPDEFVGKDVETSLLELDGEAVVVRFANDQQGVRDERERPE